MFFAAQILNHITACPISSILVLLSHLQTWAEMFNTLEKVELQLPRENETKKVTEGTKERNKHLLRRWTQCNHTDRVWLYSGTAVHTGRTFGIDTTTVFILLVKKHYKREYLPSGSVSVYKWYQSKMSYCFPWVILLQNVTIYNIIVLIAQPISSTSTLWFPSFPRKSFDKTSENEFELVDTQCVGWKSAWM